MCRRFRKHLFDAFDEVTKLFLRRVQLSSVTPWSFIHVDGFSPAHHAGDLFDQQTANVLRGSDGACRHVGNDDVKSAERWWYRQSAFHGIGCDLRIKQLNERCADTGELKGAFCAFGLLPVPWRWRQLRRGPDTTTCPGELSFADCTVSPFCFGVGFFGDG